MDMFFLAVPFFFKLEMGKMKKYTYTEHRKWD